MRHETQVELARTLLVQLAAKEPLRRDTVGSAPAAAYTSVEHLHRELDTVLSRWPQLLALSTDLPAPGTFVVRDGPEMSVLLSRDTDGVVHALANVCRHRGARVADGRGSARRFTCPYHAWSYGLTGSLASIPDPGSFPGVELGCGLPRLPVVEWGGTIWAIPRIDAPTFDAEGLRRSLGVFGDDIDAYDLAQYGHWRTHRFELDLNWKLVLDTFLEPYHFASLHRNTVGPIFVPNLCTADRAGRHVREVLPRRSIAGFTEIGEAQWDLVAHSAIVYVLFPAVVLVLQVDHVEVWRVQPRPADPGRSICDLDFYVPGPQSEHADVHWERNWQLTIDTVLREDFHAMAGVQANLASGALDHLTFGRNEPALALFHEALDDAMAGGDEQWS